MYSLAFIWEPLLLSRTKIIWMRQLEFCLSRQDRSDAVDLERSCQLPPDPKHPYDVDSSALSIPRTISRVLKIVYGGGTSHFAAG